MDRNAILSGYVTSFSDYSQSDVRPTVTKVLKYAGNTFNIRERGDIKGEAVVFTLLDASTEYEINADKPIELTQNFQAIVYVEQGDLHSVKEARYDRTLELSDQLMDWAKEVSAPTITTKVYTVHLVGATRISEEDGYLSTTVTFQSIIDLT